MRLVLISDTHMMHDKLDMPEGDAVVHCGDATWLGRPLEITQFAAWFRNLPYKHKVFVPGNHDIIFEKDPGHAKALLGYGIECLMDSGVTLDGVKFWGMPWSLTFGRGWAFNCSELQMLTWTDAIPNDVNVLMSHGPAYNVLDLTDSGHKAGSINLRTRLNSLRELKLFAFGHIHEGYGKTILHNSDSEGNDRDYFAVNAAMTDETYRDVHTPIVVDIEV